MKEVAVFGGGCFWCTEAVFRMLKGVSHVEPGYAGGHLEHPTYEQVSKGDTGHVEVVRVEYNPKEINFNDLLVVFFGSHDATQVNKQGNDVGQQYRTVIFYTTEKQKDEAERFIQKLNASLEEGDPIVTTVEPLTNYNAAEEYHKNYYTNNENAGYCQIVIAPKLRKVQKEFAHLLEKHT